MKTAFQYIGVLVFMCFAFFYTEKAVNVVKSMDEIMIAINEEKENYQRSAIDAKITEDTMIPGMNGIRVDVNESYLKMKKIGEFNANMFVFEETKPNISSFHVYDKYLVSGNLNKNNVALIFRVNDYDNVDKILSVLKEKEVKATFFLDGKWMEEHSFKTKEIANYGHEIENYGYDNEYHADLLVWTNEVVKKLTGQNSNYCHTDQKDHFILNTCKVHKMQTIIPNIITSLTPLSDVKKNLTKGSMISLEVNDIVEKELSSMINYIIQKGYTLQTLKDLLSEQIES